MTLSLFGSKSKVKAKGGGRLQAVKSVTVPGKCCAISDSDWTVFPSSYLVTLDQIYDIVGEENWIHGESNCLVNLASS
jgi:hypothetical protein